VGDFFKKVASGELDPFAAAHDPKIRQQARVGRPLRHFSEQDHEDFLEAIRDGEGRVRACRKIGVSYKTFQRHLKENADFAESLEEAELERIETAEKRLWDLSKQDGDRALALRATTSYLKWMREKEDRLEKRSPRMIEVESEASELPTNPHPAPRRPKDPAKLIKAARRRR
jgi:hypothetical protein